MVRPGPADTSPMGSIRRGPVRTPAEGRPAPVVARDPPTDTLDPHVLARLREDLGDDRAVASLAAVFLQELPGRSAAILAAARAGDVEALRAAAHTLKSAASLLGAGRLAAICRRLEDAPAAAEADRARVAELLRVCRETAAALEAVRQAPSPMR